MRTYARQLNTLTNQQTWVEIDTDANGHNDAVWLATLIQTLLGQPGESPFYANYGIPAIRGVMSQIMPDYYAARTQQQLAQYFAALTITRASATEPSYRVSVIFNSGAKQLIVVHPNQYPQ